MTEPINFTKKRQLALINGLRADPARATCVLDELLRAEGWTKAEIAEYNGLCDKQCEASEAGDAQLAAQFEEQAIAFGAKVTGRIKGPPPTA